MDEGTSLRFFVLAGFCEIGGGHLVWLWLRDLRTAWLGGGVGVSVFMYAPRS